MAIRSIQFLKESHRGQIGSYREIPIRGGDASYEVIIEDINGDQRLETFHRNNVKFRVNNSINPIIHILKRLKKLDSFYTWKDIEIKRLKDKLKNSES